uniref:Proteasome activator Blm10 mid region domain-containing protein n=1 Tax=Parascaris univalens TaxID=6257 RepID=A0A915A2Z6_PARUN
SLSSASSSKGGVKFTQPIPICSLMPTSQLDKDSLVYTTCEGYIETKGKYKRSRRWLSLLPYFADLQKEADTRFSQIKAGLGISTLAHEPYPGLALWLNETISYVRDFSLRFTPEEHIELVLFAYTVVVEPDIEAVVIDKAIELLNEIIEGKRINRKDVTIPWRPVFDLYCKLLFKEDERPINVEGLHDVIIGLREIFPLTATKEILDEIRPYIAVFDTSMERFMHLFSVFIPLKMSAEEHERYGAGLWFDELWHFFIFAEMNSSWEAELPAIFASLAFHCPGCIDWSSKHTVIFSKLLRSMNLPVRSGSGVAGDGAATANGAQKTAAKWIVWMLGGTDNSAEIHTLRLIRCLESFVHPLQEGGHTPVLRTFFYKLVQEMAHRIRIERVCKKTRSHVPNDMRLTDHNIETFVTAVLPSALFLIFSTDEHKESYQTIRFLSFIAPQLVLPKVLDLVYPSLSTLTSPHRLKQSLECLVACCVPLVRDNGGVEYENFVNCSKDWIKEMRQNAEEMGQVSYAIPMPLRCKKKSKKVSSNDFGEGERRKPLRCHVIVLLEAMVNAIDINDVDKTSLAFTLITRFFTLIPIIDCSGALKMEKYKGLSVEEKELCKITSRLPRIVDLFITRIFALITELSASRPKSSAACLGSICELAPEAAEGVDETRLKKDIQSAANALLKNCSADIVEAVTRKIFLFVSTSEFENRLAVELTCALISECIYVNPRKYLPMFLRHVTHGLSQLITEETLQTAVLDPSTMWYVMLGSTLFYVPAKFIIQNTEQFTQLHKQLLSFKCRIAYEMGCASLNTALSQLTEIYTETESERRVLLNGSLSETLPIARWGASIDKDAVKIGWHIPQAEELQLAESFIYDVVETELERLETPYSLDKDEIRKSLHIINSVLTAVMNRMPPLKGSVVNLYHSRVPLSAVQYTNSTKGLRQFSFYGECIRSLVFDRLHALLDYLLTTREHECRNLITISSIMAMLAVPESNNSSCLTALEKRIQAMINWYGDPIRGFRASVFDVVEMRINYAHINRLSKPSSIEFTSSHLNIIRDIARLGISVYAEVRQSSQNDLVTVVGAFPASRALFAADVVKPLDMNEPHVTHEQLKGALHILYNCGFFTTSNVNVRAITWPALARMRHSDKPSIMKLVDEACAAILLQRWNNAHNIFSEGLVQLSRCFWSSKDVSALRPFWKPLDDVDRAASKAKALHQCEKNIEKIESVRDELIDVCNNMGRTLHWRNIDSGCFMLVTLFRNNYDSRAMQVFLQMFHEERPSWRDVGATCVFGWLKWNKPRSIRSPWEPPAKVEDKAVPYACGMRPDNMCLAYDLNTLPTTKQLWDQAIFITKPHWGTYQWPKRLEMFAPYEQQVHLSRSFDRLTPIEKTIVKVLSEIGFLQRWHLKLLREKDDSEVFSIYTFNVVKYVFRNFCDRFLIIFKRFLVSTMRSDQRGQQRLGAEYVCGLIRGSKNWPFEKLKRMWKWLRPLVSTAIEGMLTDASASWLRGISLATRDIDMRQVHWLVELIMELAAKPAPTSWHSCLYYFFAS